MTYFVEYVDEEGTWQSAEFNNEEDAVGFADYHELAAIVEEAD